MATIPPTELPPEPSQPGQPDAPPPEVGPNAPDVDIPSPGSEPGGEPFQPID
jgi:hypothetical protein